MIFRPWWDNGDYELLERRQRPSLLSRPAVRWAGPFSKGVVAVYVLTAIAYWLFTGERISIDTHHSEPILGTDESGWQEESEGWL